jgi:hypothetical protein
MTRVPGVILTLIALSAHSVYAQNRNGKKVQQATPQEYKQLQTLSEAVGRLAYVDSNGGGSLTLDIPYMYSTGGNGGAGPRVPNIGVPPGFFRASNTNYQQHWMNLVRKHQKALMVRNPVQREQQLIRVYMEMQQLQARMQLQALHREMQLESYLVRQQAAVFNQVARNVQSAAKNVKTGFKEFDLQAADEMVVRRLQPPFEFDDKGKVKKYTSAELAALKGKDRSLPGYAARSEDLQPGQIVKVYLVRKKAKDVGLQPAQKKRADGADTLPTFARPGVRMILIMANSNDPIDNNQLPPKKKN